MELITGALLGIIVLWLPVHQVLYRLYYKDLLRFPWEVDSGKRHPLSDDVLVLWPITFPVLGVYMAFKGT